MLSIQNSETPPPRHMRHLLWLWRICVYVHAGVRGCRCMRACMCYLHASRYGWVCVCDAQDMHRQRGSTPTDQLNHEFEVRLPR